MAKHLNVPLNVVNVDEARFVKELPAMVAQLDEPLADPAPLNVLFISQLAREHGIKYSSLELGEMIFLLDIVVILLDAGSLLVLAAEIGTSWIGKVDKWLESEQVHFSAYAQAI